MVPPLLCPRTQDRGTTPWLQTPTHFLLVHWDDKTAGEAKVGWGQLVPTIAEPTASSQNQLQPLLIPLSWCLLCPLGTGL